MANSLTSVILDELNETQFCVESSLPLGNFAAISQVLCSNVVVSLLLLLLISLVRACTLLFRQSFPKNSVQRKWFFVCVIFVPSILHSQWQCRSLDECCPFQPNGIAAGVFPATWPLFSLFNFSRLWPMFAFAIRIACAQSRDDSLFEISYLKWHSNKFDSIPVPCETVRTQMRLLTICVYPVCLCHFVNSCHQHYKWTHSGSIWFDSWQSIDFIFKWDWMCVSVDFICSDRDGFITLMWL